MSAIRKSSGRIARLELLLAAEHVEGHETDADADRDVGDVEGRPAVIAPAPFHVGVNKIDDVRVTDAIDEVTECAAEHEREPPAQRPLMGSKTAVEGYDERDGERRDEQE